MTDRDKTPEEILKEEIENESDPEAQFNKELGIEEEQESYETERQKHRRVGDAFEVETLLKLREKFPGIEFRRLRNYSQTAYDIECDYCLFDCVSVDKSGRLITDHKNGMRRHKKEAKEKGLIGLIVFKYNDQFFSLNVNSKFFQKYKRPPITEKLLRACIIPPIPITEPEPVKPEPEIKSKPEKSTDLNEVMGTLNSEIWNSIGLDAQREIMHMLRDSKYYPVKLENDNGDALFSLIDSFGGNRHLRYKHSVEPEL